MYCCVGVYSILCQQYIMTSLSIETIVKGLLLPSASSSVSMGDFLDRIVRSQNGSIRQYTRGIVCRVIKANRDRVDVGNARRLVQELIIIFPDDSELPQCAAILASRSTDRLQPIFTPTHDRATAGGRPGVPTRSTERLRDASPVLTERRVHDSRREVDISSRFAESRTGAVALALTRRDGTSSRSADILNRLRTRQPPPSPPIFATPYIAPPERPPLPRGNSRLTTRLPFSPSRMFRDLTSSSSDDDAEVVRRARGGKRVLVGLLPPHEQQVELSKKKVYFSIWRKYVQKVSNTYLGLTKLGALFDRMCTRGVLAQLGMLVDLHREARKIREESLILFTLKQSALLREKFYDSWRAVFLRTMAARRQQIDGVKRIVMCVAVRVRRVVTDSFTAMDRHCVLQRESRVEEAVIRLSEWLTRRHLRSGLNAMKVQSSRFAKISTVYTMMTRKLKSYSLNRMKAYRDRGRLAQAVRALSFTFVDSRADKRRAWDRLKWFTVLESTKEGIRDARANLVISETARTELELQLNEMKEGKSSLESTLSRVVISRQQVDDLKLVRCVFTQWRARITARRQLLRLAVVIRASQAREAGVVLRRLKSVRDKGRRIETAVKCLALVVGKKLRSAHVLPAYWGQIVRVTQLPGRPTTTLDKRIDLRRTREGWTEWRKKMIKIRQLKLIFSKIKINNCRFALSRLREHNWKTEIISSLTQCDQWREFVVEKTEVGIRVVDRICDVRNREYIGNVLTAWAQAVRERKRRLARVVRLLTASTTRFAMDSIRAASVEGRFAVLAVDRKSVRQEVFLTQLTVLFDKMRTKNLCAVFVQLQRVQHERTVYMMERVSRSELSQQESVMKDLEAAAQELEADYTALASKAKKISDCNEELSNELVVTRSRYEHESRENELLLLKLNEMKCTESERRDQVERLLGENRELTRTQVENEKLRSIIDEQRNDIEKLTLKLNDYMKLSTSVQFYKNKISLQSEQIVSLQEKLREPSEVTEDVLFSSPINTKSQDLTYASSSLRGLQQAVDRSNSLRATRRSDASHISAGESTTRRRELLARR